MEMENARNPVYVGVWRDSQEGIVPKNYVRKIATIEENAI